jgi:hypothetical protein
MALSTKPNRFYPSIPSVNGDIQTHLNALVQIKESIETHERRNANYMKSFVRYEELVDLGIINEAGEFILEVGGGGSGSQTPWLSDIDGAGFSLSNVLSLEVQDASGNYYSTLGFSGSDFQILMDAAVSPQNLRITGFVGGDFIVEGTAGGGRIRQENSADSTEYIEMYHDTSQTARIVSSGRIRLQSFNDVVGRAVEIESATDFVKQGFVGREMSLYLDEGHNIIFDGDTGPNPTNDYVFQGFPGNFLMGNYEFQANEALTGKDNYVLTLDETAGTIQLEVAGGGPTTDHPHTGEVTGTTALTVQVSSITNRTAVAEVSELNTDDIALHDATDGTLKKTPINLVTDGGNF